MNHPPYRRVPTGRAEANSWALNQLLTPEYQVTLVAEVDATAMQRLREQARRRGEHPPSYTAMVIKAASLTMQRFPEVNRAIIGPPLFRRLVQFSTTDVSVAVEKALPALPGQAWAPVLRSPAQRSLADLTAELALLARCSEQEHPGLRQFMRILRWVPRPWAYWIVRLPHWLPSLWARHRGSACWVNAPSRSGVDLVLTSWPWPITFSFGVVKTRPWVVGDEVRPVLTVPLLMQFDRRVMGGGPAGRVFMRFKALLEAADHELVGTAP